jgi:hypothetical protein
MTQAVAHANGLQERIAELEAENARLRALLPKPVFEMSLSELQAELGTLQTFLHFKVCGDPRKSVSVGPMASWPDVVLTHEAASGLAAG